MKHIRIDPIDRRAASARYEGRRGLDPVSAGLVALITVGLLTPLIVQRALPEAKLAPPRMVVLNLDVPPPPPPPETPPPPRVEPVPPPAAVHVPVPRVALPSPVPQPVKVQPEPVPPASTPNEGPAVPAASAAVAPPTPVAAGDLSATMVHAPPPRYPRESRRLREQGTVVLRVLLGADGKVADIGVAKSSGHGRLDAAALDAVRKWRWRPTLRQGEPVQVRGSVEIPFVLTN
ncbi:MAG: energy transducer TonB [Sphingopyxis sp.]|uniref:energy transducer TonB n=1 Tax=Sphingopyxis sp. TaxID=1908224 RepID=UPI002ABAF900|nr:energy transducer TonB [Sphingopyxis sp.]MDZ3832668.1 energy transducer TonB [Sphingopyxis sp.]